jgi:hypothetical protein
VSTRGDRLRAEIAAKGYVDAMVDGTSMSPALPQGTIVRVVACDEVTPGRVLAFELPAGGLLVHRVIAARGERFVCRGDNRISGDGPIGGDAVVGRAELIVSPQGRVLGTVRDDGRALALARLRHLRLVLKARAYQLRAEADLLARQWGAEQVVAPLSESDVSSLTAARRVPAAVFCRLPRAERRALVARVRAAASEDMVIEAYAMGRRHRMARAFGWLRLILRRFNVEAGEAGDTALPPEHGPEAGYAHLYTPLTLRDELEAAGMMVVAIEQLAGRPALLVAQVRPRPG